MQATWKAWPHCGSSRISSPTANSARQMAQSVNLEANSGVKLSFGRERRIFFFSPLLGGGGGGRLEPLAEELPAERRRSQAHRATATRPSTQIRAQRSAARITTKSESTEGSGDDAAGDDDDDEFTPPNNLKGRFM
ncbi:hypothetical protein TorRG33x02_137890 [Trema orientale]|uniref:Uncharacterized protein n=1 Tax=Trema orientale TaxID=63057 RepID=A0A2P5EYB0_TREOI|nr:hypothetical protein TorRG33x02_137890 [Trema orientale]